MKYSSQGSRPTRKGGEARRDGQAVGGVEAKAEGERGRTEAV